MLEGVIEKIVSGGFGLGIYQGKAMLRYLQFNNLPNIRLYLNIDY